MRRFRIGFTTAAALILAWQLLLPPIVGLANNGDFGKLLGYYGLGAPPEHEFVFADTRYDFDRRYQYQSGFHSSESLLIAPALAANAVLSKDQRFDLRFAGLIHASLFLLAFALFLPLLSRLVPAARWLLAAAALLMFTDVAYAAYLNSFYMDTGSYLFLLLTVVFFLRTLAWSRALDAALMLAAGLLLVTSKPQHAVLAAPLALLFFAAFRRFHRFPQAGIVAAASVAVAALAGFLYGAPPDLAAKGAFNVVFAQILPHAQDQDRALSDLGLDASYKPYIGLVAYSAGAHFDDPQVARAFLERLSYARLARFFLTHPRDAYRAIHMSLSEAGRQRPLLGNFDSASGMRPWEQSRAFSFWSGARQALFFHRGTRYLLVFLLLAAGFSAALVGLRRRLPPGALTGGLMLAAMATLELLVPALADAIDIPRHFLLFYALFDLLLLAALYLAICRWVTPEAPPPRRCDAVDAAS